MKIGPTKTVIKTGAKYVKTNGLGWTLIHRPPHIEPVDCKPFFTFMEMAQMVNKGQAK